MAVTLKLISNSVRKNKDFWGDQFENLKIW